MLSAILAYTAGEDLISSRFSRTAAIKEAAINSTEAGLLASLLLFGMLLRFRAQLAPGLGGALKTSPGLYRYAVQQQEQVTMTVSSGGGSDFSGSACSRCESMARQVTVQAHFLHLTTHADGSATGTVTKGIIGEYLAKVILAKSVDTTAFMFQAVLLK